MFVVRRTMKFNEKCIKIWLIYDEYFVFYPPFFRSFLFILKMHFIDERFTVGSYFKIH